MAKRIPIVVSASDQATPVMARVSRSVLNIVRVAQTGIGRVTSFLGRLGRAIVSTRGLLLGLAGVVGVAFGFRSLIGGLTQTVEKLEAIGNAARRTGASVETLSFIAFIGEAVGENVQDVSDLVGDLIERLSEATKLGSGQGVEAIRRLGIQVTDLEGRIRPTDDLLLDVITKMNALEDIAEREFFTKELFGDSGARFNAFFNLGPERLAELRAEVERLGGIFTEEQVAAALAYSAAVRRVVAAWEGLKARVVESLGPVLADALNRLAVFVAALPELAGRAIGVVRGLLRGDLPDELRTEVALIGLNLGVAVRTLVFGLGRVALAATIDTIRAYRDVVLPIMVAMVEIVFTRPLLDGVANAIETITGTVRAMTISIRGALGQVGGPVRAVVEGVVGSVDAVNNAVATASTALRAAGLAGEIQATADAVEHFDQGLRNLEGSAGSTLAAIVRIGTDLGPVVRQIIASVDNVLGVSGSLAERALDPRTFQEIIDDIKARVGVGGAAGGEGGQGLIPAIRAGVDLLGTSTRSTFEFVRDTVGTVARSISTGLTSAFLDVESGAKSFGEAMKEVLGNLLRQVAELIIQFLVLRAVTAALRGLFRGGGSAAPVEVPSTFPVPGSAILNTGGQVLASGAVRHYNGGGFVHPFPGSAFTSPIGFLGGGFVPGPNVNRDIVPAMLTPGEVVINRRGVAANGARALLRANRGERITGDDGGGGVVVHQTINFQGGAPTTAADRERTAAKIARATVTEIERSANLAARIRRVAR